MDPSAQGTFADWSAGEEWSQAVLYGPSRYVAVLLSSGS